MDTARTGAFGVGVLRCVIVDDNDRLIELVSDMLARDGFDVVGVARDNAEALRPVAEVRPDVALVDLFLDHESGIDLIEDIARSGLAGRTRTILMSTCDRDDLRELFHVSRADGYLVIRGGWFSDRHRQLSRKSHTINGHR